jgi:hypothetical protein
LSVNGLTIKLVIVDIFYNSSMFDLLLMLVLVGLCELGIDWIWVKFDRIHLTVHVGI